MRYCICMVTNFLSQKIVTGLATPLYKTIKAFLFSDTHQATLKYFHKLWWTGGGNLNDSLNAKVFSLEQIKAYCLQMVDNFSNTDCFRGSTFLFDLPQYYSDTGVHGNNYKVYWHVFHYVLGKLQRCVFIFSDM